MGYPYSWGEKGIEEHCDGGGAGAFGSPRRRPEYEAEIRVAGADRAAVGRGCWHDGDRASGRQIQARGLAVAGTVRRRRRGFVAEGVDGLLRDRPRSGRPPMVGPDQVRAVVERTVPPDATHWSTRSLARAVGLGKITIQKIWREHGLKPHLIKGSRFRATPPSSTRCATWSGCISIRPTTPWSCRSMRAKRGRPAMSPDPGAGAHPAH